MPQSLSNVLLHLVFSTKDRQPFIRDHIEERLHAYTSGVLRNLNCPSVQIGGVADHVHILCSLSRTLTIADLVKETKIASTKWLKDEWRECSGFSWQSGYGVFSVGVADVDAVVDYIQRQREHHARATFQDEFRRLLTEARLSWDERYVWD